MKMKSFWLFVQTASAIGILASLVFCLFYLPVGVIALIANIAALSNAAKQIKQIDKENENE